MNFIRRHKLLTSSIGIFGASYMLSSNVKDETKFVFNATRRCSNNLIAIVKIINVYKKHLNTDYINQNNLDYNNQKHKAHLIASNILKELLLHNGGVYIKIGQSIASLAHILPEEYVEAMNCIFDSTTPSSYEDVVKTIKNEFKEDLPVLFASFEKEPIASASLAQVHEATLHNGKKVAVKVLHKHLSETAELDMRTIHLLVRALHYVYPNLNFLWLANEIRHNLPQEMNFLNEVENLKKAKSLSERKDVIYPEVYMTSPKVFVMEYMEGAKVTDLKRIQEMGLNPSDVADIIVETFCKQIFLDGYVHVDPHPGNLLVRAKNGKPELVILDHGLYKAVTDDFRVNYCYFWKSLILGDANGIKKACEDLNIVGSFRLFAAMVAHKPWDQIENNNDLGRLRTKTKKEKSASGNYNLEYDPSIASYALPYANEIVDILSKLPRMMLFMLKTNDNLRFVDGKLGSPINQYITMLKFAHRGVINDKYKDQYGWLSSINIFLESLPIYFKVLIFKIANYLIPVETQLLKYDEAKARTLRL